MDKSSSQLHGESETAVRVNAPADSVTGLDHMNTARVRRAQGVRGAEPRHTRTDYKHRPTLRATDTSPAAGAEGQKQRTQGTLQPPRETHCQRFVPAQGPTHGGSIKY
eukprot:Hpha_TRINITY_DN15916_c1_g1::TRINITY_DN15916_c1_g1_i1::g.72697::m.72697